LAAGAAAAFDLCFVSDICMKHTDQQLIFKTKTAVHDHIDVGTARASSRPGPLKPKQDSGFDRARSIPH